MRLAFASTLGFAVPALLAACALLCPGLAAAAALVEGVSLRFADVAAGREMLARRDEFVERLSPFDRAARLKTGREVGEREYLDFVAASVLPWQAGEQREVEEALALIRPQLARLHLPLPAEVALIQTSGQEEGQAAYTRGQAVILPRAMLASPRAELARTIAHELFHVASRQDPQLRERLYAVIGFEPCNEIALPAALAPRRITNPDAPRNDHRMRLRVDGQERWAVPVLFASSAHYDSRRGGEFFDYLQFRLLLVHAAGDRWVADEGDAALVQPQQAQGFFEQVGRNTDYIIHPEEILADNFALLATGKSEVPSPQLLENIRRVLAGAAAPAGR